MKILHLAWREILGYFSTPVGWLVLAGFQLLTGFFYIQIVSAYITTAGDLVYNPYGASELNLTDHLLAPYFSNTIIILLLVGPALSMRLFAAEFQNRTMELLFTSPISTGEIVLGKFLGGLGMAFLMLFSTLHYSLALVYWGTPDPAVLVSGHIAMLLILATIVAMGCVVSASTRSQLVALVFTFVAGLMLYILAFAPADSTMFGLPIGQFAQQLSISTHALGLMRGEVRLSDLAYFLGFTGVMLFATHQRVESYRWS